MNKRSLIELLACVALTGCGRPAATTQRWQNDVQRHVQVAGHGDTNQLRNLPQRHGRRIFATLGADNTAATTDVVGILLGVQPIHNRLTYIFLVAEVAKRQVTEMRLAAVFDDGQDVECKVGINDSVALASYKKVYSPGDTVDALWPPAADVYELTVSGGTVTVTEQRSGAKWTMEVK